MKTTPRDFFLNLGIMVALIWVATSTIVVLFDVINIFVPDAYSAAYSYGSLATVSTFALSSIIIVFPLLVLFTYTLHKDIVAVPERAQFAVRRWMMYLTLFLAGFTIVTDLVILVNTLLSGGTTLRFMLQALSILIVAGGTFWYVLRELNTTKVSTKHDKTLALSVSGALLALVIVSIIVSGTPQQQRAASADILRITALMSFEQTVINHYQDFNAVPEGPETFSDAVGNSTLPTDPITREPLGYEKTGPLSFKLCATFDGSFSDIPEEWSTYEFSRSAVEKRWNFEKGTTCFDRTIDPTKLTESFKPVSPFGF